MKYFLITILLFASTVFALDLPKLTDTYISAEAVPPHHEPVIGNQVARYRAQFETGARWYKLEWRGELTA